MSRQAGNDRKDFFFAERLEFEPSFLFTRAASLSTAVTLLFKATFDKDGMWPKLDVLSRRLPPSAFSKSGVCIVLLQPQGDEN